MKNYEYYIILLYTFLSHRRIILCHYFKSKRNILIVLYTVHIMSSERLLDFLVFTILPFRGRTVQ